MESSAPAHPVRLVVTDDLHRSRLTVFFRLLLVDSPSLLAGAVEPGRVRHRGHQLVCDARERPIATGPARLPRRVPPLRDPRRGVSAARRQPVSPVLRRQLDRAVSDRPRGGSAGPSESLEDTLQRIPRSAGGAALGRVPRRSHRLGGVSRFGHGGDDGVAHMVLRARSRPVTSRAARHDSLERRLRGAGWRVPLPAHRHLSVHGAEGASRRSRAARGLGARAETRQRGRLPPLAADGAAAAAARVSAHHLARCCGRFWRSWPRSQTGSPCSPSAARRGLWRAFSQRGSAMRRT